MPKRRKRDLDLNNDADYAEHIRQINAPTLQDRPIRRFPGQYRTPRRKTSDEATE